MSSVRRWFAPRSGLSRSRPDRRLSTLLETAAALTATLAAYLLAGRFLRSRRLDDLLLTAGLALLAVSNLAFGVVPAALGGECEWAEFWPWLALTGQVALNVEYGGRRTSYCPRSKALGLRTLTKRPRLDAWRMAC